MGNEPQRRGDGGAKEADAYPPNSLQGVRKRHIEQALAKAGHDLAETARLLAVTDQELSRLMRELEIEGGPRV